MRFHPVSLALLAACATPSDDPQVASCVPIRVVEQLREVRDVECPSIPTHRWQKVGLILGWHGTVVAVAEGAVAVRIDNPENWIGATRHLVMPVCDRAMGEGIKGDAIVVRRIDNFLLCRYFPNRLGPLVEPALDDRAWVDHHTSDRVRASWGTDAR